MKTIISLQNPLIKSIVALHDGKGRREQGLFIAQGKRVVSTLVASKIPLVHLLVTHDYVPEVDVLTSDDKIIVVDESVMTKISPSVHQDRMLGVFEIPESSHWQSLTSGLVLARIADPGNMGTMIRTAVAFGIQSVVIIEGADPYSPKVVQASAGTLGAIQLYRSSWQELREHKTSLSLAALVVRGGESLQSIDAQNTLLVVGSEAHGIAQEWVAQCDKQISIPMPGNAESLNAALAAGIALYYGWVKP